MQDQELTGWFELSEQAPWEPGVYQTEDPDGCNFYNYWDGIGFHWGSSHPFDASRHDPLRSSEFGKGLVVRWRGLSSDPNAKPKPKRSGNPKVTRYVVTAWVDRGERLKTVGSFSAKKNAQDAASRYEYPRIEKIRFRSPE